MFKKYDFKQNLSSKLIPFKMIKISDHPLENKNVKENLDKSKKEISFETDEETLLELSSIVCESSFETMNNIVDLEERKKKTLKKTFQKKFISKFNPDYRPKILTTTKYFTNNKQKSNSLHLLSAKKPLFLDNFFAEKVEKKLNANYSNNNIDLINENFTNEFRNENFDKKEFAFAHKLLLMKKTERTRKPNPFSLTKNIPPKEVFSSKFSQNLSFSISKKNLQNSAAEYEKVNLLQKILRKIKLNINLSKDETKFIRQQNFSNKIVDKLQLENCNKVYLAKKRALNTIKFTKFIERTSEILNPEYKNSKRRAASLEFNQSPLKKNIKNNNSNLKETSKVKFHENLRNMVFNTNNMILEDKKFELFNQMKTKKNVNSLRKNTKFLDFSDLATSIIKNEKKECQNS